MKKIYILLHIAVILAGFTGVFGKLITLNEGLLVWYRVLFSSIILFIITRLLRANKPTTFSNKLDMAKTGMLITIHWVFFYASIKYSNISIGVVCYCLTSFFTAIFKPAIDRKRVCISELLLSVLTLLGISLIFHFDTSYRLGIALGVISSAFAALYTIFNERLVRHHDTKTINYYQMIGGMVGLGVLLPVYLHFFPAENIIPDTRNTLYLILLSLFCTVGLYVLVSEILKKIPAFTLNLTFNLEPIYAIIIAFLFFGESKEVNLSFYIGLILIIISVVLQSFITIRQSSRIKL
ncbi:Threonine/homoserine efflux transporter RhtA [Porphyromonadaceae bacterium KH3CP3RA]|nr:Threonine/homoserine efflux transporter RhtA [Porphyromonadaceae bacterium KH3CP3RA]